MSANGPCGTSKETPRRVTEVGKSGSPGSSSEGSIIGMKLSVSLPKEDVALLDAVVVETRAAGRSAVIQQAIELLREARLVEEYRQAALEWESSGDAEAWASTDTDGVVDETW